MDREKPPLHLLQRIFISLLSAAMVAVSSYLMLHFYEVHFPTKYNSGPLCDISGFWNCDVAAFSPFGQFLTLPTAFFGLFWGALLFLSSFFKKSAVDRTNYTISFLNLLGCFLFGAYSLVFLKGLCPGCVAYYILSAIVFFIFMAAYGRFFKLHVKTLGVYTALFILSGASVFLYNKDRFMKQEEVAANAVKQFLESPSYAGYSIEPPHYFESGVTDHDAAPLKLILFSDYECPVCAVVAKMIPKIASRYWGKISIGYVYFPLDSNCNAQLSGPMHPHACMAARLSFCAQGQFQQIHDELYENQRHFSPEWFDKQAQAYGLAPCYYSESSTEAVRKVLEKTEPFEIAATPTMLINGRKIDGILPLKFLFALLDGSLKAALSSQGQAHDDNQKQVQVAPE